MDNYYFKDGAFHLKSKWSKTIRGFIAGIFVATSLTMVNTTAYSSYQSNLDWKSEYIGYIQKSNPTVKEKDARDIVLATLKWANQYKLDEKLILAVAKVESNFYNHAISPSGAYGLMQVIPVWHKDKILAARKDVGNPELFNISTNIYLGARVLKDCVDKTTGLNKALLCYAGNTSGYDQKVLAEYSKLQKI
jgi:soluble lytic murein transglycosylase-like protein